jgi:TonB family protein
MQKTVLILFFLGYISAVAQNPESDSLVRSIINERNSTGQQDQGIQLIKDAKYEQANIFFSNTIKNDSSDKEAYFKRGVVKWQLNDSAAACRDWSAVLALGDTETFKLLDANCHGNMLIEEDTLPSEKYHRLFSAPHETVRPSAQVVAEVMPVYPGGEMAMMRYLGKNVRYPEKARAAKIQGTVYVNFIISRKGKVIFPYVVRGIGGGCDEEALRLIRSMPNWKPGMEKGKPVLVRYSIPVRFVLR